MKTIEAIKQCGRWAYDAKVRLHENPFTASSYNSAWKLGWMMREQECTRSNVVSEEMYEAGAKEVLATLQKPL